MLEDTYPVKIDKKIEVFYKKKNPRMVNKIFVINHSRGLKLKNYYKDKDQYDDNESD